jgi:hypothetical protein
VVAGEWTDGDGSGIDSDVFVINRKMFAVQKHFVDSKTFGDDGDCPTGLKSCLLASADTLALHRFLHPGRPIGPPLNGGRLPAPGAQQPTGAGVDDAAALARWPLHWWQTASLALAVAAGASGGGGVSH